MDDELVDHAGIMNSCANKEARVGLLGLSGIERVIVLVSRANFEIELGGLSTFYYNSSGDYPKETVAALESIGAIDSARALQAVNTMFPHETPPRDRQHRWHELQALKEIHADLVATFEKTFASENPDVFSRLCDFIDTHARELVEHEGS